MGPCEGHAGHSLVFLIVALRLGKEPGEAEREDRIMGQSNVMPGNECETQRQETWIPTLASLSRW